MANMVRYAFVVRLFHSLLSAGFNLRFPFDPFRLPPFPFRLSLSAVLPAELMSVEIGYARVKQGNLLSKRSLVQGLAEPDSATSDEIDPVYGRLHRLENGRIVVVYSYVQKGEVGKSVVTLNKDGKPDQVAEVPLKHAMQSSYFTYTERGGSAPSNTIDLLELSYGDEFHAARYAEIEVIR